MLKFCGELDLAPEAVCADPRGDVLGQHLDDHATLELFLHRHEHAAHSTAAELALYGVAVREMRAEGLDEVRHGPKR